MSSSGGVELSTKHEHIETIEIRLDRVPVELRGEFLGLWLVGRVTDCRVLGTRLRYRYDHQRDGVRDVAGLRSSRRIDKERGLEERGGRHNQSRLMCFWLESCGAIEHHFAEFRRSFSRERIDDAGQFLRLHSESFNEFVLGREGLLVENLPHVLSQAI